MLYVRDPYYDRPEVSNSDLTDLDKLLSNRVDEYDPTEAYAFGALLDCSITEPEKVDYYKLTCAGYQHTRQDFELAEAMKKAFYRDPFCKIMAENSEFQKVGIYPGFPIEFDGYEFTLDVRCKFDLYAKPKLKMSGDIKSTTSTTEKQFRAAIEHFNYDRQAAWYMDIEDIGHNMIIGISKVNKQVFKVPVDRNSDLYKSGRAKYRDLAFKYWTLFHFAKTEVNVGIPDAHTVQ